MQMLCRRSTIETSLMQPGASVNGARALLREFDAKVTIRTAPATLLSAARERLPCFRVIGRLLDRCPVYQAGFYEGAALMYAAHVRAGFVPALGGLPLQRAVRGAKLSSSRNPDRALLEGENLSAAICRYP